MFKSPGSPHQAAIGAQLGRATLVVLLLTLIVPALPGARDGFPSAGIPLAAARAGRPASSAQVARLDAAYEQLPLAFEPNVGQATPGVRAVAHGVEVLGVPGVNALTFDVNGSLIVTGASSRHPTSSALLRLSPIRANPRPTMELVNPLPGRASYFLGPNSPSRLRDIPLYGGIVYRDIYPGIDLMYSGRSARLTYRFLVHPSANPDHIQLSITGMQSARVDTHGDAALRTGGSIVVPHVPVLYQEDSTEQWSPIGRAVLQTADQKNTWKLALRTGTYDPRRALAVSSELDFGTYLDGSGSDQANAVAVDAGGAVYVAGQTDSADFPTTHQAFQYRSAATKETATGFVAKLNAKGNALVYVTYLGGTDYQESGATAVAVDKAGDATVAGWTDSAKFPTTRGAMIRRKPSGTATSTAFVTRLSPSGTALIFSTYLGDIESGRDIYDEQDVPFDRIAVALDARGDSVVVGNTQSAKFPTTAGALQPKSNGKIQGFAVKLNPQGTALLYGTYLLHPVTSIALDAAGDAVVAGGGDNAYGAGGGDKAYVAKLNSTGSAFLYSVYPGGDVALGVAVDGQGNAAVTGLAYRDLHVSHAFQPRPGGTGDAFVVSLDPMGRVRFATYLGGNLSETGVAIAADGAGNIYVTGQFETVTDGLTVQASTFPVSKNALQRTYKKSVISCAGYSHLEVSDCNVYNDGRSVIFLASLTASGVLAYSTLLSGSMNDNAEGITVDARHRVTVVGETDSSDFPSKKSLMRAGPLCDECQGGEGTPPKVPYNDAYLLRVAFSVPLAAH